MASPQVIERQLVTTREVCELLGVSRKQVFRMIAAGDLLPIRLSQGPKARLRFEVVEIERLIESRRVTA